MHFYGELNYLDSTQIGDARRIWDPNRFGWMYSLATAYTLTDDPRYAEKFATLTLDWFEKNPYPFGINYCSVKDVAVRAYAWLWAAALFRSWLASELRVLERLIYGIWLSCRHVEKNLSYYHSPNTHLTGEALSLYACGAAFPEFRESPRWRELGETILAKEASRQFHVDGTHRELSTCYHLYSTDFYLHVSLIAHRLGLALDPVIPATARLLSVRLAELSTPDLMLPQHNDCDGGRLTWFCIEPLDASPSLAAAASFFPDFTFGKGAVGRLGYDIWMVGLPDQSNKLALTKSSSPVVINSWSTPCKTSEHDSGIVTYKNRHGDYLMFQSGPFGYMDCPHSHDAPTSFVLYLAGHPIIVDSGTGLYNQHPEIRTRFRSARGKSILLVNGDGPSQPDGCFTWRRVTNAKLEREKQFQGGFHCAGSHQGYSARLGFAVSVHRYITLFDDGVLVLVDRWQSAASIDCSCRLTLDPTLSVHRTDHVLVGQDNHQFHYASSRGMTTLTTGPFSSGYGHTGETNVLELAYGAGQQGQHVFVISRIGLVKPTQEEGEYEIQNSEGWHILRVKLDGQATLSRGEPVAGLTVSTDSIRNIDTDRNSAPTSVSDADLSIG
jgi:hypothetical protein